VSERTILSYFPGYLKAAAAKDALLSMGVAVAQVERIGRFGEDATEVLRSPISGEVTSQANMLLNVEAGDDARVLMGSDPSISGMSSNGMAGGHSYLLTVIAHDEQIEEAVEIIKKHEGYV
jgi:hypothetical protein